MGDKPPAPHGLWREASTARHIAVGAGKNRWRERETKGGQMRKYAKIEYVEEIMREGMQIESAAIPVEDKLRLLDAVGETGLKQIEVGSFVSPKYTPQMACMDELMHRFKPKQGVKYVALGLNPQGLERARQYSPPLVMEDGVPLLRYHMCDVFIRRNVNTTQEQQIARWPSVVAKAQEKGATEAGMSLGGAWGSNWLGPFKLEDQMDILEQEHRLWDEAGIKVTHINFSDAMSWVTPTGITETLTAVKERWPEITHFDLHLHNARGLVLTSIYAALQVLEPTDTVVMDGSLGGVGGCPYCGNGRATGMVPTEDLMHMLETMGIDTGVDIDKLIDCVWLVEEIIGRRSFGHIATAGPLPMTTDKWYPMDLPFIETLEQAKHFKLGPKVYEGCMRPWREPIRSPRRPEV